MKLLEYLKPNPEFIEKTKEIFLSEFRAQFPERNRSSYFAFKYFIRGMALGVGLMVFISGASVYADQKNVGVDNFLYPLKRSYEAINLAFTNKSEEPALQLKLAERRLHEIEEAEKTNPQDPKINELLVDFKRSVSSSLAALNGNDAEAQVVLGESETSDVPQGIADFAKQNIISQEAPSRAAPSPPSLTSSKEFGVKSRGTRGGAVFCYSLKDILDRKYKEVNEVVVSHPRFLEKFERKCGPIFEGGESTFEPRIYEAEDIENILDKPEDNLPGGGGEHGGKRK